MAGTIDCDIHPAVPGIKALLPYMTPFWQDSFVQRGIDGLEMQSYPPGAPITARADWRLERGPAGSSLDAMRGHALDRFGIGLAICNTLYGGQVAVSETMGAAICSAVNDWIAEHWLDQEPRLRASIVVPAQAPLLAAEEIERKAADRRFVQMLMPVACEMMLGRSYYWPIYEAAAAPRPADRPACRQHVPLRADLHRLAEPLPARLRRAQPDLRGSASEPRHQRHLREIPRPARRADRDPASPGCPAFSGARSRPGAACVPRRRG